MSGKGTFQSPLLPEQPLLRSMRRVTFDWRFRRNLSFHRCSSISHILHQVGPVAGRCRPVPHAPYSLRRELVLLQAHTEHRTQQHGRHAYRLNYIKRVRYSFEAAQEAVPLRPARGEQAFVLADVEAEGGHAGQRAAHLIRFSPAAIQNDQREASAGLNAQRNVRFGEGGVSRVEEQRGAAVGGGGEELRAGIQRGAVGVTAREDVEGRGGYAEAEKRDGVRFSFQFLAILDGV